MPIPLTRAFALVVSLWFAVGAAWAESVRVAGSVVKLRQGPSTSAALTASLARGEVLEVLEKSGDWYRVRTPSGATGYVSARWVEPLSPAAEPVTAPSAKATVPAPQAPPTPGLEVEHVEVSCVVAGRHPRLEACFRQAERVGRAQVLFRADENGPWYSVDMRGDGSCRSALLPKPTTKIQAFRYFVEVVDRSFAMTLRPGEAPQRAYAPRVVSRESECREGLLAAAGSPNASVVVNVARDAGGQLLQAGTASAGGTPASLSGFSLDGVTMPGGVTHSGSAAKQGTRGGGGLRIVAIGGGVLAAGAVVAVVAGGGDASGGDSRPGNEGTAPAGLLTGRWVGTFEEVKTFVTGEFAGMICPAATRQLTVNLVQTGSRLTGDFQLGAGTSPGPCGNTRGPTTLTPVSNVFPLVGTVSGGTVTIETAAVTLTGTHSVSNLTVSGTYRDTGGGETSTFLDRWTLTRQ